MDNQTPAQDTSFQNTNSPTKSKFPLYLLIILGLTGLFVLTAYVAYIYGKNSNKDSNETTTVSTAKTDEDEVELQYEEYTVGNLLTISYPDNLEVEKSLSRIELTNSSTGNRLEIMKFDGMGIEPIGNNLDEVIITTDEGITLYRTKLNRGETEGYVYSDQKYLSESASAEESYSLCLIHNNVVFTAYVYLDTDITSAETQADLEILDAVMKTLVWESSK